MLHQLQMRVKNYELIKCTKKLKANLGVKAFAKWLLHVQANSEFQTLTYRKHFKTGPFGVFILNGEC